MSMNIGSEKDDEIISEINTTPLVDVMLVLLIICLGLEQVFGKVRRYLQCSNMMLSKCLAGDENGFPFALHRPAGR